MDHAAVADAVAAQPELLKYRGKRGENLLHVCCAVDVAAHAFSPSKSVKTAAALIDAGIDVNAEAFREGSWKATPLWYALGRGKNLRLAQYLLGRGSTPEHCLWAAAYNDDAKAVRLLARAGATIDSCQDGDTPLLFAVKWSRFTAARALLECGADPNFRDERGNTALHYMRKKRSDPAYLRMFARHGAVDA